MRHFFESMRILVHMFLVMGWVANGVRLDAWHHKVNRVHPRLCFGTFNSYLDFGEAFFGHGHVYAQMNHNILVHVWQRHNSKIRTTYVDDE